MQSALAAVVGLNEKGNIMANHATYSPSSAHRWAVCAAAVAMEEGLPDYDNAFASQGTAEHFLGAFCLENDCDAVDCLGDEIGIYEDEAAFLPKGLASSGSFEVTAEMVATVQAYVDYVRKAVTDLEGSHYVEVDVPIGHITGEEGATGRADAIVVSADAIVVVDKKFKWGVEVEAENNDQFIMYASGALVKFSAELKHDFKHIILVAAQKAPYSVWETTPAVIDARCRELASAARLAQTAMKFKENWMHDAVNGYFTPGESQCRRCKAVAACPAAAKLVTDSIGVELTDHEGMDDAALTVAAEQASLGAKKDAVGFIKIWCEAVDTATFRALTEGKAVEGYKLVTGKKGNRAWRDDDEAEKLFKKYRTKTEEMYALKLNSPAKMELFFASQPKRWAEVAKLVTQADGHPSVAKATDKRPAIEVKPVVDAFDDLTADGEDLV